MKTIIQHSPFILIVILTAIVTGLIFLVLPVALLWMKVYTYIGSDAIERQSPNSETGIWVSNHTI